jgi:hypothetical protein
MASVREAGDPVAGPLTRAIFVYSRATKAGADCKPSYGIEAPRTMGCIKSDEGWRRAARTPHFEEWPGLCVDQRDVVPMPRKGRGT